MSVPKDYALLLHDAWCDEIDEDTESLTDEEIHASLLKHGMTQEELDTSGERDMRRAAGTLGRTLFERVSWMTRAQCDAWLATTREYSRDQHGDIRQIWAKALEEQEAAGELPSKLQGELAAARELLRADAKGVSAQEMAVAIYQRHFDETLARVRSGR